MSICCYAKSEASTSAGYWDIANEVKFSKGLGNLMLPMPWGTLIDPQLTPLSSRRFGASNGAWPVKINRAVWHPEQETNFGHHLLWQQRHHRTRYLLALRLLAPKRANTGKRNLQAINFNIWQRPWDLSQTVPSCTIFCTSLRNLSFLLLEV